MKAIARYIMMCMFVLTGLASTSCSNETDGSGSQVVLDYMVGEASAETRAEDTEAGSDELNENKISRLDLFVFDNAGTLTKHLEIADATLTGSATSYQHKILTSAQLTRTDIAGTTNIYLVANLSNLSSITTLEDLKAATINQTSAFVYSQKQEAIVMDAKLTGTEESGNDLHIKFQLKRALAKIRLTVEDASGNTIAPSNYACQLIHYAANGAVISEGTCANNALNKDAAATSKMVSARCTQNSKTVFYSYANEWLDQNKNPKAEEPVNADKQTYIMLKGKYNGKDYYYKVPVNKRISDTNDETTINWDNYKAMYSISRNTIYDVTAKIDRQGGESPEDAATLYVKPTVKAWNAGAEYAYDDAITIKTLVELNQTGVGSYSDIKFNNATYGPKISFSDINTKGRSWVLQADSPDYGFIYATKVKTDGSYNLSDVMTVITGTAETKSVDAFYVVPRSVLDYTQRNNYTCTVCMVAAPLNQKVIINASETAGKTATGTGTQTEMVFTQIE